MPKPPLKGLVVDPENNITDGDTGLLGRARGLPWRLAKVLEKETKATRKDRSAENARKRNHPAV